MRRFLWLLGLTILSASETTGCVQAQVTATSTQQAAPVTVAPHRAIYTMSMASAKSGSNITDVSGRLEFEWRDVCDGWAIQQHMKLHIASGEGEDQDIVSNELTWESKDGKKYNFNIHHETNGQETEAYHGKASQKPDGSVVVAYSQPKGKTLQLPAGTMFPTAHTEYVLSSAADGQKFFTRRVFDGSDTDGASDISAFIAPLRPTDQEDGLSVELKKNQLVAADAWPVHLAFFKINDEKEQPDYEMDLGLLPNSIARHIRINYSDFSIIGTLVGVESIATQNCS